MKIDPVSDGCSNPPVGFPLQADPGTSSQPQEQRRLVGSSLTSGREKLRVQVVGRRAPASGPRRAQLLASWLLSEWQRERKAHRSSQLQGHSARGDLTSPIIEPLPFK